MLQAKLEDKETGYREMEIKNKGKDKQRHLYCKKMKEKDITENAKNGRKRKRIEKSNDSSPASSRQINQDTYNLEFPSLRRTEEKDALRVPLCEEAEMSHVETEMAIWESQRLIAEGDEMSSTNAEEESVNRRELMKEIEKLVDGYLIKEKIECKKEKLKTRKIEKLHNCRLIILGEKSGPSSNI